MVSVSSQLLCINWTGILAHRQSFWRTLEVRIHNTKVVMYSQEGSLNT